MVDCLSYLFLPPLHSMDDAMCAACKMPMQDGTCAGCQGQAQVCSMCGMCGACAAQMMKK